jgi:hypothetical protein
MYFAVFNGPERERHKKMEIRPFSMLKMAPLKITYLLYKTRWQLLGFNHSLKVHLIFSKELVQAHVRAMDNQTFQNV